jgi:hypothetical protein
MKPLRQPGVPTSEPFIRSDSWWEHVSAVGFTARASAERQRMGNDLIGRKVPDQIMGQYLGIHRPTE